MIRSNPALLLILIAVAPILHGQTAAVTIPAGTPLAVRLPEHVPMRVGLPIHAELIYPLYADNSLVVPAKSIVNGTVLSLTPNRKRRLHAKLGGDFTPFHTPVVKFTELILPDGAKVAIETPPATDGAPVSRAVQPKKDQGGFLHKRANAVVSVARDDIAIFTNPGKGDRFLQFVYSQLPYHPERIEKETAWTTEIASSVALPAQPAPPPPPPAAPVARRMFWQQPLPPVAPVVEDAPNRWTVEAFLNGPVSSETSKAGQRIQATVAKPILNKDGSIAIPQGSTLVGTISQAQPARSFGRTGTLSFNFRELALPGRPVQNIETTLTGADGTEIVLDAEGRAKGKPQDKVSVPLFLLLLASRPLDQEHGRRGGAARHNAEGGGAGLGLIGTILGAATGSAYFAAGIGYYGAAISIYDRWIAKGKTIQFPRDTRIVVQTAARRSAPMKPNTPAVN